MNDAKVYTTLQKAAHCALVPKRVHQIQASNLNLNRQAFLFSTFSNPSTNALLKARRNEVSMRAANVDSDLIKREPSPDVLSTIRTADAFCFDVDSTFCQDESIDEIAAFLGVGDEVAALTARAMGGTVLFQDALRDRLGVMKPSASDIENYLTSHPPLISPGIPDLLSTLRKLGKEVFLVSGGFRQIIHPLAAGLDISLTHVFANTILFNKEDGSYAGFDPGEFTSHSGGKAEAVVHIKKNWGLKKIIIVGDGATDAEAKQPGGADAFIGYGGTVYRENIAERADWYVMKIEEITNALKMIENK
jgi:phosphoserine phosphatase